MLYSEKDTSYILVSDGTVDCGKLVKEYASFYQGKGGGNKVSYQAHRQIQQVAWFVVKDKAHLASEQMQLFYQNHKQTKAKNKRPTNGTSLLATQISQRPQTNQQPSKHTGKKNSKIIFHPFLHL